MSKVDFQYIDDVKTIVCKQCSKSDKYGKCLAPPETKCVLETYLPQVTRALETAHGGKVDDYLLSLRTEVCSVCKEKTENGYCYTSDSYGCPLESFFRTVADAAVSLDAA